MEVTCKDIDLSQAGLSECLEFLQAARFGDCQCLTAIGDGYLRPAADKAVQESHPVVPGRAAPWVSGPLHQATDSLQSLDMIGVPAQGELDLSLLQDGINAA
jgi:hypothetical protein